MNEVLDSLDLMRPSLLLETLQETPAGFQILPLGGEDLDRRQVLSVLLAFSDLVDYLLVDVPFGQRASWSDLYPLSRRVLVTGTSQLASMMEMRSQIEALGDEDLEQRLVPVLLDSEENSETERAFLTLMEELPLRVGNILPRISPEGAASEACSEYSRRLQQLTVPLLRAPAARSMVQTLSEPPPRSGSKTQDWVGKILTQPPRRACA